MTGPEPVVTEDSATRLEPVVRLTAPARSLAIMLLWSVLPLCLLAWGLTGVVLVNTNERAIRFHFGRPVPVVLTPGLHVMWPYPFDQARSITVDSLKTETLGFQATLAELRSQPLSWTSPHGQQEFPFIVGGGTELVGINALVTYAIRPDNDALIAHATSAIDPKRQLKVAAQRLLTIETSSLTLDDLLARDLVAWSDELAERLGTSIDPPLPGIEIVAVRIVSVHPPSEVAAVFLDQVNARIDADKAVLIAQQDARSERLRSEMMALTAVADARGAASKRLTAVTTEAKALTALAELDLSRPELLRLRAFYQAMQEALEHQTLTVLDAHLPPELRLWFGTTLPAGNR